MRTSTVRASAPVVLLALLAMLLGSCSSGSTSDDDGDATPTIIEVELRDGAVVGGSQRHEVDLDDEVTLTIRSDVDDVAHVHVYDISIELHAGEAVTTTFTADIGGVIPVHLHHDGVMLVQLAVA